LKIYLIISGLKNQNSGICPQLQYKSPGHVAFIFELSAFQLSCYDLSAMSCELSATSYELLRLDILGFFLDFRFDVGDALFEIADAFAEPLADLRQFARAENDHDNYQDDQKFPVPESEHNGASFLCLIEKGRPWRPGIAGS